MAGLIWRDLLYNKICSSSLVSNQLRVKLYKLGGVKLQSGVNICPHCFLGNSNLEIGENTFVNYECWFNTAGKVIIGKRCNIAYKVTFITSTHEIANTEQRAGQSVAKGISVGDGTWIGANVTILPGVNIGAGVIIAAGSVVVHDCENDCMYAGNPARKIKSLE